MSRCGKCNFSGKMFTFELMTEADRREAAAIDRRRAFEEERRKRIFNPRMRLIGVGT